MRCWPATGPANAAGPWKPKDQTPPAIQRLLADIGADPQQRLKDADLRRYGLQPSQVRRWFKKHHGLTFQGYLRALRIGRALGRLDSGEKVIDTAFASGYESLSGFTGAFKKKLGRSPSPKRRRPGHRPGPAGHPAGPDGSRCRPAGHLPAGILPTGACWKRSSPAWKNDSSARLLPGPSEHLDTLRRELDLYFQGRLREFKVPLVMAGTEFQKRVWQALQTIPYGQTRSYKQQAVMIGQPKAVRAVGRANGDNRIAIIIPCHRVIGDNGQLTGYGGGLWRKRFLLDLEQKKIK